MKKFNILFALVMGAVSFTSCMDEDWKTPENITDNPPYGNNDIAVYCDKTAELYNQKVTTIEQLKEQYKDVISNNSCKEITDDIQLQVVVNGNDQGGNIYKQISVQDATGGIIVGINATDQFAFMPVNQKILINLKGAYIGGYGEMAQIGTQYNAGIGRMEPSDWEGRVRLLTQAESADSVSAIADTIDFDGSLPKKQLWGRIVRLKDVTISGDGTQTLAPDDGSVPLTSNCANRKITGAKGSTDIVLRTSTYSDFASRQIPEGKVTIYGVCTSYRNTFQILMRTNSDLIEQ